MTLSKKQLIIKSVFLLLSSISIVISFDAYRSWVVQGKPLDFGLIWNILVWQFNWLGAAAAAILYGENE